MKEKITEILKQENIKNAGFILSQNGETFHSSGPEKTVNIGELKDIVATLPAILKLVERRRKKIALNHPVSQYHSGFKDGGKEDIQIVNLLTHTSGLPNQSYHSLSELKEIKLDFKPGSKVSYSPMNFQLLPSVFEQALNQDFETFLETFIFDALRMESTKLERLENGDFQLISSLNDLSHFAEMIQNNGTYDFMKVIRPKAVQLSKQNFTSFLNEDRGLGWAFRGDVYGFTSQTGSMMWFNPKKKAYCVLLVESSEKINPFNLEEKVIELLNK